MKLKIDVLSDLHADFYFHGPLNEYTIHNLYGRILQKGGDVLVVAGNIGHDNDRNIRVLKLIREVFGYRHILCVLGNHDYYLPDPGASGSYRNDSRLRAAEMRDLIDAEEGMRCLDGEVVEIGGVRFGGCDSWYDATYIERHFPKGNREETEAYVSRFWEKTMSDADYLRGVDRRAFAAAEKEKIRRICRKVDVMITHVNPSIEKEHVPARWREMETTGYFTFDGTEFLESGSMKYWIFGHTHERMEYEAYGVKCLCNPMGYPDESLDGLGVEPMRIEIQDVGRGRKF